MARHTAKSHKIRKVEILVIQIANDIDRQEFIDYCLNPAIEMRSAIYKQLCIIDAKEYDVPSKRIPEIVCK